MAETNALNDMVSLKPYPNVSAFLSGTKQAPTPKGYIGEPEIFPAQQELQQARAKAKEDIGKADINIEKAKREEQASKMQVDVDVEKESAERIKEMPERMALKAKQEEASALKFMPTKDTAQDIAGLFGLVGVISMALGGGGRMSGHLALGNMNAMMEGYRKGRTDLNKKEAVEFDKNFKAMQAALETLSREYKDALEIEKSDKERGRLERHMTLAKAGSPVLKAMEERLGPVRVNDFLNELQTTMDKSVTLHNSLQKSADDRQAKKDEMAQRERIAKDQMALREKLAKAAAAAKDDAAKKGGTLKPGAKITEGYIADTVLKTDIEDLKKDLANPKLVEMLKQYRVEAFLTEEGKVLNQLITSDIPNDLQKFLVKVRDIRNNYYLTISGKAVTGGEALRNYGTVPQPGDDSREMINKLNGMAGRVNQTIQLKRQLFGLPELNLDPGMKTNLKPNDDYSLNSQPSYEVNKVYTDSNGNKAKYLGNDEWEEIQ